MNIRTHMDLLEKKFPDFSLWQIGRYNLTEFSTFVINVNREYYCKDQLQQNSDEADDVIKDDISHFNYAFFYALKNKEGEMIGTVKICQWNEGLLFPIQKHFGIEIGELLKGLPFKPNKIWHMGRFAIDNNMISRDPVLAKKRITIFKILLIAAFRHICEDDNNVMIAECDCRLNEKVKLLGIHSTSVGESKKYLGSETIAIFNTGKDLKHFLNTYGHVWNL